MPGFSCVFQKNALTTKDICIPCFRGCLCSSVVGISPTEGHLSAGIFKTTEWHGTTRNRTEARGFESTTCAKYE